MRLKVVCVGKAKRLYADLARTYEHRIRNYARLEVVEVPEVRYRGTPSPGESQHILQREAESIRRELDDRWYVVLLDQAGTMLTSEAFSRRLQQNAVQGKGDTAFVVGGSLGMAEELKAAGDLLLSLSPMTLPHQLARVVLLEQLYRAFTIQRGEPYHK